MCWQSAVFFHTILSPFAIRLVAGSQWGSSAHPCALNRDASPNDDGATTTTDRAATAVAAIHLRLVMRTPSTRNRLVRW